MTKVLVTGGLGFIGSNLVKKLTGLKVDVVSIDNLSSNRPDYQDLIDGISAEFLIDCFSSDKILSRIKNQEFDYIFHLAAIPRVGFSVENPYLTTDVNILKTVKLLEACVGNVKRFIFSSSSSVYGGADELPTPASHVKDPKSP